MIEIGFCQKRNRAPNSERRQVVPQHLSWVKVPLLVIGILLGSRLNVCAGLGGKFLDSKLATAGHLTGDAVVSESAYVAPQQTMFYSITILT